MAKLAKGSIRPTLEMAFKIEHITAGAIPASAWVQAAPTGPRDPFAKPKNFQAHEAADCHRLAACDPSSSFHES